MTKICINNINNINNIFKFSENKLTININIKETDYLLTLQNTAKKISNIINDDLELIGENWNLESIWAFIKGSDNAKKIIYPKILELKPLLKTKDSNNLDNLFNISKWCKNLINHPPQEIYPESLCHKISEYITELSPDNITSTTITAEKLLEHQYNGIYTVGKCSEHPPAINILDFNPNKITNNQADIVLVGKGITFDSGGYSIKNNTGMLYMRKDMSGAATLAAALALAIKNGLKKRVILITCSAENLVGPNAFKLGDIIKYKNGLGVEITNTDAEGRLVLADGLIKAQEYNPKLIIDAATLTGAAHIALGSDRCALFRT